MEKIALLPGGFKPPHAGHYNMAKWLIANTDTNTIVIKVGSKEREGITREMSLKLWNLYRTTDSDSSKLTILPSDSPSPVKDVYDFIEKEAPKNSTIYLGMGEKDINDQRFKNIEKYAKPKGIKFQTVLVPPQAGGVSGTKMREFIKNGDKSSFQKYIPNHLTAKQKEQAWSIVTGLDEDLYNPEDKVLDYMRGSEWKAGMPDGPKDDIPRAYKYKRGGMYTGGGMGFGGMYEHYSKNIPLEIMTTPEEQMKGMIGRDSLKGGMLFPYNEVGERSFHMKGCLISLDIVFINQGVVDKIHHNCPPCNQNNCPNYTGIADNVLELPSGYCKQNNINMGDQMNNIKEQKTKYGGQHHLSQYMDQIKLNHGPQQYRDLQILMSQQKDEEVNNWLRRKGYMNEKILFSKNWWLNIINEILLTEGGAAGHMAHPFNLPNINSGKDLKDIFEKAANSLQSNPGSVKIDGVNSSIRLIDLNGEKQFVMDRGSKKPLDIKGITKADLEDRFKPGHGMVKVGGEVLDMFNKALPSLESDLKKLGAWNDPNILFNMEYVSGKTNVQDYGSNFIAIHGLNKIESKEVQGKRQMLTKRISSEVSYDKAALQSMLDNLTPIAKKNNFEVYGSVPTEMNKKPNFNIALSKNYTVKSNEGDKTQSLDKWLNELNDIPEKDFIFMNVNGIKKKVGAVSKQVYINILQGENIDNLFKEDKQKAIEGFTTYLATEKLGDEILKVLDSPMGSVENHEGVVIRDKSISNEPFKITGKFILGGMVSDF